MIAELNNEQMDTVLRSECVCHLGCHADGETYVVPLTYAYDGSSFFCHSADGTKTRMMRKNPQVCVEVYCMQDMAHWQSVIAKATFVELEGADARDATDFLEQRLAPLMTTTTSGLIHSERGHDRKGAVPITFRLDLYDKTGRYEKR
ncbi:MAG: pyridoxamine 5'-phosphate oxidase family protein [Flavobacteriales bacterium]